MEAILQRLRGNACILTIADEIASPNVDLLVCLLSAALWPTEIFSHSRNSMLFNIYWDVIFFVPFLLLSVFNLPANMPILTLTVELEFLYQ